MTNINIDVNFCNLNHSNLKWRHMKLKGFLVRAPHLFCSFVSNFAEIDALGTQFKVCVGTPKKCVQSCHIDRSKF